MEKNEYTEKHQKEEHNSIPKSLSWPELPLSYHSDQAVGIMTSQINTAWLVSHWWRKDRHKPVTEWIVSTHWHFTFSSISIYVCCHSNETRAPIANPANSAQLEGTPYHSPKLHPGPCNSVGMRRRTDAQTHIDGNVLYTFRLVYTSCKT